MSEDNKILPDGNKMTTEKTPIEIALSEIEETLKFLQPLVRHVAVPPVARKLGVRYGVAVSGCHRINEALETIAALRAQLAKGKEVDVEALKKDEAVPIIAKSTAYNKNFYDNGWNACIDHLASQGYLQTPPPAQGDRQAEAGLEFMRDNKEALSKMDDNTDRQRALEAFEKLVNQKTNEIDNGDYVLMEVSEVKTIRAALGGKDE